jgi:hypothetical protein
MVDWWLVRQRVLNRFRQAYFRCTPVRTELALLRDETIRGLRADVDELRRQIRPTSPEREVNS